MKELHNHIFSNTTCISKETMLRYINQQLSKQELYEVEKHMLDCELCSDAMAGMEYAQNSSVLFAIDNEIDQRVRLGKHKAPIMRNLMVAASVLALIFTTFFTFNYFNKTVDNQKELAINTNEEDAITKDKLEGNIEQEATGEAVELESLKEETKIALDGNTLSQITENSVEKSEKVLAETDADYFETTLEDAEMDEEIAMSLPTTTKKSQAEERKKAEAKELKNELENNRNNNATNSDSKVGAASGSVNTVTDNANLLKSNDKARTKKSATKYKDAAPAAPIELAAEMDDRVQQKDIIIIHDHKVVDYTVEYQKQYDLEQVVDIKTESTSANFATKEDKKLAEKEREELVVEITYKATLDKAIAYYKATKYTLALDEFSVILKEHPEEVNSLFYGALSNYHLQHYDKAIKGLNKVLINPKTAFNQEAKWYKALTLIGLKQTDNAKKLLKEIVAENGFYKAKAEEQLNLLK